MWGGGLAFISAVSRLLMESDRVLRSKVTWGSEVAERGSFAQGMYIRLSRRFPNYIQPSSVLRCAEVKHRLPELENHSTLNLVFGESGR